MIVGLRQIAPPALEPVTLAEAKAHVRVDTPVEDTLLTGLIQTSRLQIEATLDLALIRQSWRLTIDAWSEGGALELPIGPVESITAVTVRDAAGGSTVIPPAHYFCDAASRPPRLIFAAGAEPKPGRAMAGVEIELVAGFGPAPADVPAPLRHAILLLVAHWYEHREADASGIHLPALPAAIGALVAPFRKVRL
jgi:uncharacterized phiE125 gp8 family phage protein